jgi:hypothetical protein
MRVRVSRRENFSLRFLDVNCDAARALEKAWNVPLFRVDSRGEEVDHGFQLGIEPARIAPHARTQHAFHGSLCWRWMISWAFFRWLLYLATQALLDPRTLSVWYALYAAIRVACVGHFALFARVFRSALCSFCFARCIYN